MNKKYKGFFPFGPYTDGILVVTIPLLVLIIMLLSGCDCRCGKFNNWYNPDFLQARMNQESFVRIGNYEWTMNGDAKTFAMHTPTKTEGYLVFRRDSVSESLVFTTLVFQPSYSSGVRAYADYLMSHPVETKSTPIDVPQNTTIHQQPEKVMPSNGWLKEKP